MQQSQGISCESADGAVSSPHGMSAMATAIWAAATCCSASFAACAGTTRVEAIKVMTTNQWTRRETRRGMGGILVLGRRVWLTVCRGQQGFHMADPGLLRLWWCSGTARGSGVPSDQTLFSHPDPASCLNLRPCHALLSACSWPYA